MTVSFDLATHLSPCGDQPRAIEAILGRLDRGERHTVLLGITGSGKTFTMANVIARSGRPALVLAHNKTLAAQLFGEFRSLFPSAAVHYFVSYYDYYQPEAYVPASDTYIEKDSLVNEEIDRMRHAATHALLTRSDVIIVASVSCIYGIGSSEHYASMIVSLARGQTVDRDEFLRRLVEMRYDRNDYDFHRGVFRVRGDVVEVFPTYEHDRAVRIEWFGDDIDSLSLIDPLRGKTIASVEQIRILPGSHYATASTHLQQAAETIRSELRSRLAELESRGKLLEMERLEQRTLFDLEMIEQLGYCTGIENYSRHLSGRTAGDPPPTLLDYFPRDFLMFIDESHQTIPQLQAMYRGDRSRKETLVEYGFRLPSALDNRPLRFEEFQERVQQVIYVSATPGDFELQQTHGEVVEQLLRPTGLLDPDIEVRPVTSQVDDLLAEIRQRVGLGQRVLVTTLTKRMAEDLTEYYQEMGVRVRYLHSDVDTLERIEIIRELRLGSFDVLVGINLLREGLDLPEVALVAILDADKEGFLRSTRALIQTAGRAARNLLGHVIFYADRITDSMRRAMDVTHRRRAVQAAYNESHGITPESIKRSIVDLAGTVFDADYHDVKLAAASSRSTPPSSEEIARLIEDLRARMKASARELAFERAAELRDQIRALEEQRLLYPLVEIKVPEYIEVARSSVPVPRTVAPVGSSLRRGSPGQRTRE
jgi:excinuclease ABC subunit B